MPAIQGIIQKRESRARRGCAREGCTLRKSRIREPHLDNYGGYMIVDTNANYIVAGARYDLTLEDVEAWLRDDEITR